MNGRFKPVREVWLGLGLTLFAGYFFKECDNLNQMAAQYPRIILGVLLALSIALLIQGIFFSFKYDKYNERYGKKNQKISMKIVASPLFVFGAIIVYLALFHYTNFFIATAVFVPVLMVIFGERKVLSILLTTVGLEVFVYLVFVRLLNVYFPL